MYEQILVGLIEFGPILGVAVSYQFRVVVPDSLGWDQGKVLKGFDLTDVGVSSTLKFDNVYDVEIGDTMLDTTLVIAGVEKVKLLY